MTTRIETNLDTTWDQASIITLTTISNIFVQITTDEKGQDTQPLAIHCMHCEQYLKKLQTYFRLNKRVCSKIGYIFIINPKIQSKKGCKCDYIQHCQVLSGTVSPISKRGKNVPLTAQNVQQTCSEVQQEIDPDQIWLIIHDNN